MATCSTTYGAEKLLPKCGVTEAVGASWAMQPVHSGSHISQTLFVFLCYMGLYGGGFPSAGWMAFSSLMNALQTVPRQSTQADMVQRAPSAVLCRQGQQHRGRPCPQTYRCTPRRRAACLFAQIHPGTATRTRQRLQHL